MAKSILAAYDGHAKPRCYGRDPARHSRSTSSAQHPALAAQTTVSTITLMSPTTPGSVRCATVRESIGSTKGAKSMTTGSLVIKLTAGKDDAERCNQAFNVAATALASGVSVSLWLTSDATWLALPGHAEQIRLAHATPLDELLATVLNSGMVTICSQCAARREITEDDLIEKVRIAGAATFVAEVMAEGAKPLIY
jgi:predicted peroxiredoxin